MIKTKASKQIHQIGKWVEKKTKSQILVCPECQSKYIKTRPGQKVCVKCLMKNK